MNDIVKGAKVEMGFALQGIKVLDVSQVAAVPMAARHLADFGADVIHVERPATGDSLRVVQAGMGGTFIQSEIDYVWENYNRGKRSVTLDLSQDGGREILYKLAEKADVFLTNFRPFEIKKFKLEYETLNRLNPRLIYGSLTGYGKKGMERDASGYDQSAYWARSGIPHKLAALAALAPGTPPSAFLPAFGDSAAALALAYGVMMALFVRERTGVGQDVDVSLFHTGVYQLSFDIAGTLVTQRDCERLQSREDSPNPLSALYQTKDGRWLLLSILHPERYWSMFCRAIEREDLEHDPRFEPLEPMIENRAALMHILDEIFLSKTLDEWKPRLNEEGLPWSPVQNLPEVVNDPQARANDFFVSYDHPTYGRIEVVANPINLGKTPATVRTPAPEFGQHTEEVLLEYGYTWEDIAQLKENKVIA